jgi:hypothetical protein
MQRIRESRVAIGASEIDANNQGDLSAVQYKVQEPAMQQRKKKENEFFFFIGEKVKGKGKESAYEGVRMSSMEWIIRTPLFVYFLPSLACFFGSMSSNWLELLSFSIETFCEFKENKKRNEEK